MPAFSHNTRSLCCLASTLRWSMVVFNKLVGRTLDGKPMNPSELPEDFDRIDLMATSRRARARATEFCEAMRSVTQSGAPNRESLSIMISEAANDLDMRVAADDSCPTANKGYCEDSAISNEHNGTYATRGVGSGSPTQNPDRQNPRWQDMNFVVSNMERSCSAASAYSTSLLIGKEACTAYKNLHGLTCFGTPLSTGSMRRRMSEEPEKGESNEEEDDQAQDYIELLDTVYDKPPWATVTP